MSVNLLKDNAFLPSVKFYFSDSFKAFRVYAESFLNTRTQTFLPINPLQTAQKISYVLKKTGESGVKPNKVQQSCTAVFHCENQ